ncbi:molybdopterin oxidoreductase [Luteitalea sp. TBR-22]|nr:molybdopterin oxidoreductase [Luteitalea sp. TBR-22]
MLRAALTGAGGLAGGLLVQGCAGRELPPTYGHLLRLGDNLTYVAHRAVLPTDSLVREYTRADISSFPAIGTTDPADPARPFYGPDGERYGRLRATEFREFALKVEGRVARPGTYTLEALRRYPSRTQITRHTCEEGWSAIAEWTGVALSHVLAAAGTLPSARFVQFHAFDGWADGIDMVDALHPQTLLAYAMNGRPLPVPHGGPLRLRVERQLGYKSLKFLDRIVVTDTFDDHGRAGNIQNGWSWYVGI